MTAGAMSFESCYRLADLRSDAGDQEVALAIVYGSATAEQCLRWIDRLAWAALEKNARKRKNIVLGVKLEIEAHGLDAAGLPMSASLA